MGVRCKVPDTRLGVLLLPLTPSSRRHLRCQFSLCDCIALARNQTPMANFILQQQQQMLVAVKLRNVCRACFSIIYELVLCHGAAFNFFHIFLLCAGLWDRLDLMFWQIRIAGIVAFCVIFLYMIKTYCRMFCVVYEQNIRLKKRKK